MQKQSNTRIAEVGELIPKVTGHMGSFGSNNIIIIITFINQDKNIMQRMKPKALFNPKNAKNNSRVPHIL